MSLLRYALVTVPLVLLLGTISGRIAGAGEGNGWFASLAKPEIMPPGWVLGLAWTLLYILLGLVLAILLHARGARWRGVAVGLFAVQLLINYGWSPAFFAFHQTGLALLMAAAMIVLTVALIVLLWRIRPVAALLLLPYLAWLCFAALLTYEIMRLNPDAEALAPQPGGTDIVL